MTPERRIGVTILTVGVAALAGGLLGDVEGAAAGGALAVVGHWQSRVPLAVALVLLVAAAASTVAEGSLAGTAAAVARFPLERPLAARLGRFAGVALAVAVIMLAAQERRGHAGTGRVPGAPGAPWWRRIRRPTRTALHNRPEIATALTLVLLAPGLVLALAGDGALAPLAPIVLAAAALSAALALTQRFRSRARAS